MAVYSSFVSSVKYRVPEKVASQSCVEEGWKGTFVEVLKKPPPGIEGSREVRGKILHSREQSMQEFVHILKGDGLNFNEGTSRVGKDFSLKAMHDVLLDMKFNVDLMFKWVKFGLGPVGSEGKNGMDMQQGIMKGGQASGMGHKRDVSLKGKNK